MATTNPKTAKDIVASVLGLPMTREIWTVNFMMALPISVQYFDLPSILPAVFYMFRFAYRRGKGQFMKTFGDAEGTPSQLRRSATVDRVATKLARTESFAGFEDETARAILGDLLLGFCLENRARATGRHEQVQRVAPAHYMASWVDLPGDVGHLRYVPETIVAMLANQPGEWVEQNQSGDRTWFAVGQGFEENVLLRAFHQGVRRKGEILANRATDEFDEDEEVGLDQLLMIRLAQQLETAPDKLRGGEGDRISNQRPIAELASQQFSEDIRRFVRDYAGIVPRHAFVEMLESCMAVGLTTILTSTVELLFHWADTGDILPKQEQMPTELFVDCSNGVDQQLRNLAEQSMDDFMRRIERLPTVLMALRLLDYSARRERSIRGLEIKTRPYATEWLNLLGALLHERQAEARDIHRDLDRRCMDMSEALQEDHPAVAEALADDDVQPSPVWRMAESLAILQGRGNTQTNFLELVDSVLLTSRPNGLARKRSVRRRDSSGSKMRVVRSIVLADATLDYLVHRHVLRNGNKNGHRALSFGHFLEVLHERHGLCIDRAPAGMAISNDLLQANRAVLERRLRDLGLLIGVNDAETMKLLRPRFQPGEGDDHGDN